jgi:hypothetical protein
MTKPRFWRLLKAKTVFKARFFVPAKFRLFPSNSVPTTPCIHTKSIPGRDPDVTRSDEAMVGYETMKKPSTAGRRGPQDRTERRIKPAELNAILRGEPTGNAIPDGGGLFLDNRAAAKVDAATGKPILPRVGRWFYQFQRTVGGKVETVKIPIGSTNSHSLKEARAARDALRAQREDPNIDLKVRQKEKREQRRKPQAPFS